MAIVRVPYEGGPMEYWNGEKQFEEFDTATDLLTEGQAHDLNPNLLDPHQPDVIERYVLARNGRRWVLRYEGRHERELGPGERPRRVAVDERTRVVGGPSDGGWVILVDFDAEHPERYNTLDYKRTRFGEYAEEYELRSTAGGWCWIWTQPS